MALVTYGGHTQRAKDYMKMLKANETISELVPCAWIGIGGTTQWTDENNPPAETEDEVIDDVFCYAKVRTMNYVRPLADGESIEGKNSIEYKGTYYIVLNEDELDTYHCKHIIIEAYLEYDDAPLGSYRKIGLYTYLKPVSGIQTGQRVIPPKGGTGNPNDYIDPAYPGILEAIANDTETKRSKTKRERIAMLIEF